MFEECILKCILHMQGMAQLDLAVILSYLRIYLLQVNHYGILLESENCQKIKGKLTNNFKVENKFKRCLLQ